MEPAAKPRRLEVTVLSAEDLGVGQNPVTEDVFVVVRADSINSFTTTKGQGGGDDSFISWNETFMVDVAEHARSITFEVKCKTAMGAVKDVGVARIAVSDFLGGTAPDDCPQFLSYRLRGWDGGRSGVIHFSVRARKPEHGPSVGSENSSDVVVTGIPTSNV